MENVGVAAEDLGVVHEEAQGHVAELETVVEGLTLPEGLRWRAGRLWFADMHAHRVHSVDGDGRMATVAEFDDMPSGLGWLPDGSLLVVLMRSRQIAVVAGGEVGVHADLTGFPGDHLNDMVVDRDGRAYVGNFGFDLMAMADPRTAALIRVDPNGSASVAAEDLAFPNGSVITPDCGTLIVGETAGARYTAFTIGPDGMLTDRRVWGQVAPAPPAARGKKMTRSVVRGMSSKARTISASRRPASVITGTAAHMPCSSWLRNSSTRRSSSSATST